MASNTSNTSGDLFPKLARNDYPITLTLAVVTALILAAGALCMKSGGSLPDALTYIVTVDHFPEYSKDHFVNKGEYNKAKKLADFFIGLAMAWAIVVFIYTLVRERCKGWWHRHTAKNHVVVCGLGWQGRSYLHSLNEAECSTMSIAIEIDADDASAVFCEELKIRLVRGNAGNSNGLAAAAVHRAKQVYICTGDQDENLQITSKVKNFVEKKRNKNYFGVRKNTNNDPLEVVVSLGSELTDGSNAESMFSELLKSTDQCTVSFYDPSQRMARMFYYRHKVYQWRSERPLDDNGKRRVHLVFLGFSRLAGELILQYSRIWPCADHEPPLFTVICRDDQRVQAFRLRHPILDNNSEWRRDNFSQFTESDFPGELQIITRDSSESLLDEEFMSNLEAENPVTAVVSANDDVETNLQRASHCRLLSLRHDLWSVPILTEVERQPGMHSMLGQSRFEERHTPGEIVPFGSTLECCDIELLEYMDRLAKGLHEQYRATIPPELSDLPGNCKWEQLPHALKCSNYRAADHAMVKLSGIGFRWTDIAPEIYKGESLEQYAEILAMSEHRSWICEKVIAGYRRRKNFPDDRDDKRLFHNDIKPWSSLTKADRAKDRNQVVKLEYLLKQKSTGQGVPTAAKVLRVGLLGRADITQWQARQVHGKLVQLLNSRILDQIAHEWIWLDLISPLGAGSECTLLSSIQDIFQSPIWPKELVSSRRPVSGYRLLIPYANEWSWLDGELKELYLHQGPLWLGPTASSVDDEQDLTSKTEITDEEKWKSYKGMIEKQRSDLIGRMGNVDVVNLLQSQESPLGTIQIERTAESYIANNADIIIAAYDSADGRDDVHNDRVEFAVSEWKLLQSGEFEFYEYQIDDMLQIEIYKSKN